MSVTVLIPLTQGEVARVSMEDAPWLSLRKWFAHQARSKTMYAKHKTNTSSKYKGVTWDKSSNKWLASITVNYKRLHLGRFTSESEAAKAYDKAAIIHFGEFAKLNF